MTQKITPTFTETLCAICDNNFSDKELYPANFTSEALNYDVFSARRRPDRLHYRIVRCDSCGLIRSNSILDEETLTELYAGSFFTYAKESAYAAQTYAQYSERALRRLPENRESLKLLEIGCGNGFFLKKIKEAGLNEVYGVEPSLDAVNQSGELKSRIHVGMFGPGIHPQNSFDLVCAFQIFDHISRPNDFLKECRAYLKQNGLILLINHNIGSATARLLGERCPMIDIEHPYLYDKTTWRRIVEKNGFEVVEIFDVYNQYPLSYWMKLMPLPASLKTGLLKGIEITALGHVPLTLGLGNMGLIARKNK